MAYKDRYNSGYFSRLETLKERYKRKERKRRERKGKGKQGIFKVGLAFPHQFLRSFGTETQEKFGQELEARIPVLA